MSCRNRKIQRVRAVALAAGAGVLGSLALAPTSMAAAPIAGTACQAADGKISGRGASFQTVAQQTLVAGYAADVCGPVAPQYAGDPAGSNMVVYNYPVALATGSGSGQGQRATSCRTDAFGGTDIPYTQATLLQLDGAPGATGGCAISFTPPYTPTGPWPKVGTDAAARAMSFPVAGAALTFGVNLDSTPTCLTPPTQLRFSTQTASRLIGGDYLNWNNPELVADNPELGACDKPVTRVVRLDRSGTTQVLKNYLKNADPNRSGAVCEPATTWLALSADANNQTWPVSGTCAPLLRGAINGNPAVIAVVDATDGAVGYSDLADYTASGSTAILPSLQSATDPAAYVSGSSGAASNCAFAGATLPGSNALDAVGLNAGIPRRNWASDLTASNQKGDVTYKGNGYPICGLTWALVYTTLNGNGTTSAIAGLTANQRRTLYSYFTYVFSPAAQGRLASAGYAPLPASFLTRLRQGYQANF